MIILENSFYVLLAEKEKSKTKVGPTPSKRTRKELKEGEFDINSIMPWKLDFTTNEKEATFWLWEQKWRTFYNFIGKVMSSEQRCLVATLRALCCKHNIAISQQS